MVNLVLFLGSLGLGCLDIYFAFRNFPAQIDAISLAFAVGVLMLALVTGILFALERHKEEAK
jgi:hypothetical protein